MQIRRATLDDAPALVALARDMFHESRYAALTEWHPNKAGNSVYQVLMHPATIVFIALVDEVVVGFLQAARIEYPYSYDLYTRAEHLYLTPAHRGGAAASALVKAYEDWSDLNDAKEQLLSTTTGVHPEATTRFFQREGYVPVGWVYTKGAGNV